MDNKKIPPIPWDIFNKNELYRQEESNSNNNPSPHHSQELNKIVYLERRENEGKDKQNNEKKEKENKKDKQNENKNKENKDNKNKNNDNKSTSNGKKEKSENKTASHVNNDIEYFSKTNSISRNSTTATTTTTTTTTTITTTTTTIITTTLNNMNTNVNKPSIESQENTNNNSSVSSSYQTIAINAMVFIFGMSIIVLIYFILNKKNKKEKDNKNMKNKFYEDNMNYSYSNNTSSFINSHNSSYLNTPSVAPYINGQNSPYVNHNSPYINTQFNGTPYNTNVEYTLPVVSNIDKNPTETCQEYINSLCQMKYNKLPTSSQVYPYSTCSSPTVSTPTATTPNPDAVSTMTAYGTLNSPVYQTQPIMIDPQFENGTLSSNRVSRSTFVSLLNRTLSKSTKSTIPSIPRSITKSNNNNNRKSTISKSSSVCPHNHHHHHRHHSHYSSNNNHSHNSSNNNHSHNSNNSNNSRNSRNSHYHISSPSQSKFTNSIIQVYSDTSSKIQKTYSMYSNLNQSITNGEICSIKYKPYYEASIATTVKSKSTEISKLIDNARITLTNILRRSKSEPFMVTKEQKLQTKPLYNEIS